MKKEIYFHKSTIYDLICKDKITISFFTTKSTAKWIWDRSIYSIIKPKFDIIDILFQDFWRFAQSCKKLAAFARKIVFVIVFEQFCYRNNNKNNFVSKCCKFLANLCKSSEILEQCHVKWWLKYRNNWSVSWRLGCIK